MISLWSLFTESFVRDFGLLHLNDVNREGLIKNYENTSFLRYIPPSAASVLSSSVSDKGTDIIKTKRYLFGMWLLMQRLPIAP